MKISICLQWAKSKAVAAKTFKSLQTYQLLREYGKRIEKINAFHIRGPLDPSESQKPGTCVWLCDFKKDSKALSSEEISSALQKLMNSGTKQLHVVIGGPNGFSEHEASELDPDLKWAFGPITLPHELAAVIAGEQLYRGLSILNHLPYHLGH